MKRNKTGFSTSFILMLLCSAVSAQTSMASVIRIPAPKAKSMMDSMTSYVLVDVRTPEEFASGHIPGAILLPDYDITAKAEKVLPDKTEVLIVYCRSGRRSAAAAKKLVSMGYTNVYDMGGIISWPYEIEKSS